MSDRIAYEQALLSPIPLRKVNTRGSRTITGCVFSRKMPGHTIDGSSTNELQFIKRAEIDPRVSQCLAQPIKLAIRLPDGGYGLAFPDFAIMVDGQWELHEVKPDAEYARSDVADRLRRTADAAERAGYPYSVALASELRRRRDRDAIEDAWRRIGRTINPIRLAAFDRVLEDGPATIGSLLAATAGYGTSLEDCHAMIASGHLRADMTRRADASMIVHLAFGDVWFERLIPFHDPRGDVR